MAGCYGNHPEDRHFERMLHKYLAEQYPEDGEECEDEEENEEDIDEEEDS